MTVKTLMSSTVLASFLAAPAMAQDVTVPATDPVTGEAVIDPNVATIDLPMTIAEMTVDEFIGLNVLSANGDDVGEIDYVIASPGADAEAQAVIGVGGFLGLGEYTVALPISAFTFDPEGRDLIVSASEEELRATPEFDESGAESVQGNLMMADFMGDAEMDDNATMDGEADTSTDDGADTEDDTDVEADTDTEIKTETESESDANN